MSSRSRTVAGVALAIALGVAYLTKVPCVSPASPGGLGDVLRSTNWCYSDVSNLYDQRGFDRDALPYDSPPVDDVDLPSGQPPPRYPVDYTFEYPPGVGFGAWLVARVTTTERGFFLVTAATLAVAAAVAARSTGAFLAIRHRDPRRLLLVTASPSLALLAFQNWDLWSIAPAVLGVLAAATGRWRWAAVAFGVGAGVKWWPAVLVLTLLAGPWAPRQARWRPLAVTGLAWAALQLPALLVSPSGWWASITFHLEREPNRASPVGVVSNVVGAFAGPDAAATATTVATLVGALVLAVGVVAVVRGLDRGRLTPADGCFAAVALLLVTSKVVSVQFLLWLLPFAAVATVPWVAVGAADALNAATWLLWAPTFDARTPLFWSSQLAAGMRTVLLAWLLVRVLRPRRAPA